MYLHVGIDTHLSYAPPEPEMGHGWSQPQIHPLPRTESAESYHRLILSREEKISKTGQKQGTDQQNQSKNGMQVSITIILKTYFVFVLKHFVYKVSYK